MESLVGVIDYAAGNSSSVLRALDRLSIRSCAVASPEALVRCTHAILPGVGSAGATMRSLAETGLAQALTDHVGAGKAYVGICVGLQVLFEHSEEDDVDCLGWLAGSVRRLPPSVRVPQIGWNLVTSTGAVPEIGQVLPDYFYFVNSYVAAPADQAVVAAEADYGGAFPAAVRSANIFATQFHLEKSGPSGLGLLRRVLSTPALSAC